MENNETPEEVSKDAVTPDVEAVTTDYNVENVGEFFGTLQQSIIVVWRAHLATTSYAVHMATNEYYEDMLDKVDGIIECYQGTHGKITKYRNVITHFDDVITYLTTVQELTRKCREEYCDTTELESCCDDILSLMSTTLYKLKNLS